MVFEASANRKVVYEVAPWGFVIPLIPFTSLSVKDYKVIVSRFAVEYKKNVNIYFIVSKNLPISENMK